MSYDIPDEIKYKEKIVFNLTFEQFAYACAFGAGALIVHGLPLPEPFKTDLPALIGLLGAGFVLLNLEEKVFDLKNYFFGFKKADASSPEAQKLVGVRKIDNDTVYLMDGGLRSILKVHPVNFGLLEESQKKALALAYREFLNHLTEPIQILVRTSKPDLKTYFEQRQQALQSAPDDLKGIFENFMEFEQDFLENNQVRERNFYLIVYHKSIGLIGKALKKDLENVKQLDQRTRIIQEKLLACGLKSSRLKNDDLNAFLSTYSSQEQEESPLLESQNNPLSQIALAILKIRQFLTKNLKAIVEILLQVSKTWIVGPLKKFYNIVRDRLPIKRKESEVRKPDLALESITPDLEIKNNYALVNGIYHRIVKATGYPRKVEDGWLQSFLFASEPYDITLHIQPSTINTTLTSIHRQIVKQSSDLLGSAKTGTPNPSLEIKRSDTMKVYESLYKGEEKMFEVSLYVDCQAPTLDELDLLTEKCKANLNALLIIPKTAEFRMAQGIKTMLPQANDALHSKREFLTSSLGATFPFLYPVKSNKTGLFFGHERNTLNPIFVDFDAMSNKHFFVLGISGSGKSYTSKFLIMQHLLDQQSNVFILDPNGEYRDLTRKMKGQVVTLSKESDSIINLFDLAGEDYSSKMLTLISVFDIITGGLTESQKGALNEALDRVYRKRGILAEKPSTWTRKPPTFSDLSLVLKKMMRKSGKYEEKSAEVLANRVRMYSKKGFFGFLDRQTKVDLNSGFLDFDLSALPAQVRQLVMFSVLELISRQIRKDKNPKVVLIDEGWSLLRSKEAENYILEFIKTSRKFNASIGFITQEIEDLLRSDGGKSILNTTSTKILLRQNASNLKLIGNTLGLSEKEQDRLLQASKGQGLLLSEQGGYEFEVNAPPKIHSLITTDPNEQTIDTETIPSVKTESKVELSKGFYLSAKVTEEQAKALRDAKYQYHKSMALNKQGMAYYYVKTQSNESPEHALLCWMIADELKKAGIKAKVNATVEADVTFNIGGKKYCFEVETGEGLTVFGAEKTRQKFETRKKDYKEVIIVVANRKLKIKYERIANTKAITRTEVMDTVRGYIKKPDAE